MGRNKGKSRRRRNLAELQCTVAFRTTKSDFMWGAAGADDRQVMSAMGKRRQPRGIRFATTHQDPGELP